MASDSRQYLPRKGTETHGDRFCSAAHQWRYSRQYLPRKGTETELIRKNPELGNSIPDNIYPARGRKRSTILLALFQASRFPTIFTPQGDGNMYIRVDIKKHYPNAIPDNIYPARGRKHNRRRDKRFSIEIPDNIYPARGRKRRHGGERLRQR